MTEGNCSVGVLSFKMCSQTTTKLAKFRFFSMIETFLTTIKLLFSFNLREILFSIYESLIPFLFTKSKNLCTTMVGYKVIRKIIRLENRLQISFWIDLYKLRNSNIQHWQYTVADLYHFLSMINNPKEEMMTPIIFYQFHYEVGDQYDLTNLWILNENINIIASWLKKIDQSWFLNGDK